MKLKRQFCSLYSRSIPSPLGRTEGCDIGKLRAEIDCNGYLLTETNSLIRPKSVRLVQIVFYKNVDCVVKISHLHACTLTRATLCMPSTSADLAFINPRGQTPHSADGDKIQHSFFVNELLPELLLNKDFSNY